ncbi:uncharacterized protein BDZ99DRAFT_217784 [Mytilinidion resinicola]|uniref:Cupin 2 conserved barrel domain-containing protein n=1 Tax=Mytilinidion resinicola TaxID=574789 RepID=A0A6A6XYR5_9PEZI|nr:uncharacterized protein BDZ99DRAFT_217784 [Mytilinidion resinicola]KAF2801519.1 hypothetical protein BDZ99DRAFT_217784 [Mytilinidion resinicola]
MKAQLDAGSGESTTRGYLKADGSEISCTLGAAATRISPGTSTPKIQETASSIFHVIEACGTSTIDGKEFSWKKCDAFCIPSWHEYQHHAGDGETVYLYRVHDKPMLQPLGFYRYNGQDVESLVSE